MTEKLSISIVTMNNMEMNRNCLRSIFEHTKGLSFKVFVLDNNSKDDTVSMIRRDFPQVELIESKVNRWFTANQNIILKQVTSEYVLLLNNDTLFLDNSIKSMLDFFELQEDAGAVTCKILNPDHSFQKTTLRCDYDLLSMFSIKTGLLKIFPKSRIWGRPLMGYADRNALQQIDVYSGACIMLRKKVLDEIGLLDENISFGPDDYDYSYRLRERDWKIYYLPTAQVIHLDKQTRITNSEFFLEEVKGIFYFYLKHYGKFKTLILKVLMLYGAMLKPFHWLLLFVSGKIDGVEFMNNLKLHLKFIKLIILYSLKTSGKTV